MRQLLHMILTFFFSYSFNLHIRCTSSNPYPKHLPHTSCYRNTRLNRCSTYFNRRPTTFCWHSANGCKASQSLGYGSSSIPQVLPVSAGIPSVSAGFDRSTGSTSATFHRFQPPFQLFQ